jgi:hypothetical protein
MMQVLPEKPPEAVTFFCKANGYTDPQKTDGQWWAIAPGAFIPTPLPYLAKGLDNHPTPYTLKIRLEYGVLEYRINAGAIVSATWLPNQLFGYRCRSLTFAVGLDLLEIDAHHEVKWRLHTISGGDKPHDWRTEQDSSPGMVVRAIALSIQYLFDEDKAA